MLKEAIEKILSLAPMEERTIDGRYYATKGLHAVGEPLPAALKLSTLTGVADYLKKNIDGHKLENLVLHVAGHDRVDLYSKLDDKWQTRKHLISVTRGSHGEGFDFGEVLQAEKFVIDIQACFVQDANTRAILAVAGNMKAENSVGVHDDGISQNVEVKTGLVLAAKAAVPNPVQLRPYRTFGEIEQPVSSFVFRVHQAGPAALPRCSLHEADGGQWKLAAILSIRDWLAGQVEGVQIIA